jgi:hypothetical protein
MTKKDFELIAGVLKGLREDFGNLPVALDVIAVEIASELQHTNDRFDSARFLTACGVN